MPANDYHSMPVDTPILSAIKIATKTNGQTISQDDLKGGAIYMDNSGGNVAVTVPTGANLDNYYESLSNNSSIPLIIIGNHASNTITLTLDTGVTTLGLSTNNVISAFGKVFFRKTGTATYSIVRAG